MVVRRVSDVSSVPQAASRGDVRWREAMDESSVPRRAMVTVRRGGRELNDVSDVDRGSSAVVERRPTMSSPVRGRVSWSDVDEGGGEKEKRDELDSFELHRRERCETCLLLWYFVDILY